MKRVVQKRAASTAAITAGPEACQVGFSEVLKSSTWYPIPTATALISRKAIFRKFATINATTRMRIGSTALATADASIVIKVAFPGKGRPRTSAHSWML